MYIRDWPMPLWSGTCECTKLSPGSSCQWCRWKEHRSFWTHSSLRYQGLNIYWSRRLLGLRKWSFLVCLARLECVSPRLAPHLGLFLPPIPFLFMMMRSTAVRCRNVPIQALVLRILPLLYQRCSHVGAGLKLFLYICFATLTLYLFFFPPRKGQTLDLWGFYSSL